jgi:hypothetical protein
MVFMVILASASSACAGTNVVASAPTIRVAGEVKRPGEYVFRDGETKAARRAMEEAEAALDAVLNGGGEIVAWRTTEPLPQPPEADLREWPLAGPCVRDVKGKMCAFLLGYPGKLSRHDGKRWEHISIELGSRNPYFMTGDDRGRLQIGFMDAPSGSYLVTGGAVTNWADHTRAWAERFDAGPAFFRDGSPFRPRHVVAGKDDWVWMYDGRSLSTGRQEYDYYESPPYRYFWLGPDGACYRAGGDRVWVFSAGRWTETQMPPLSIGPDGIRADTAGKDRLPVVCDGQLKLPLPAGPAGAKSRALTLQGNETFIAAADGGGWVGQYRIFRNAYYPLAGRVYPRTSGHYLVADNVLRFQPRQTLKADGEVCADGEDRRLTCRISGVEPLYKPRLLVFLDGEFQEMLASPDGVNLPPLPSGQHTLEVYAADGFGVVSDEPLRLAVDGGPACKTVNLEMDEAWSLKPERLQVLPAKIAGRSVLGLKIEIDSDGVIWILVDDGVIGLDFTKRQAVFHQFSAKEILSARGRVWALGAPASQRMEWPLYELRRERIRHAVDLYDDAAAGGYSQISADGQGGIWTLSHRIIMRWDGRRTQSWERPVGFEQCTAFVPCPDGAIISTRDRYFRYRKGELSEGTPWDRAVPGDGGCMYYATFYPLGTKHLVHAGRQALVDVDTGRISKREIPSGDTCRLGANGNLYVWQSDALIRVSGKNLAVTRLPRVPPPFPLPSYRYTSDRYAFLATTKGILVYPSGRGSITMGPEDGGAVEYGWQEGVEPGDTASIRQAPDGRIWILRTNQLLVYDSVQPAKPGRPAYPDWRMVPIWSGASVGAFGTVWYMTADGKTVVETDGKDQVEWKLPVAGGFVIVSDQGSAMLVWCEKVFLLLPGGKVEPASDQPSAVLTLVKRGAKAFAGGDPPVVAADGRVFFHGRIWDGQTWQALSEGRVSLDQRGDMFQLRGGKGIITVYRIDGCKATAVEETTKCLIDADGLRWCDPGLLEAQPGCLPVWHKVDPHRYNLVSVTPDSEKIKIDIGEPQAFPTTNGQFLLRMNDLLHVLDANGLTALPSDRLPCGNKLLQPTDNITPLPNGRWAFGLGDRLFISPPNLRFNPQLQETP